MLYFTDYYGWETITLMLHACSAIDCIIFNTDSEIASEIDLSCLKEVLPVHPLLM